MGFFYKDEVDLITDNNEIEGEKTMKDFSYKKCHKCGSEVKKIKKEKEYFNEKLNDIIKVTVPVWECKECENIVYPSESLDICNKCAGK